MLSFPLNLIPNYVRLAEAPKIKHAQMKPSSAYFKSSLQISNTSTGGLLELIFQNYPVKPVLNTCKPNNLSPTVASLDQLGWAGAWTFYHIATKDGHLCFDIPATHKLWDRFDYSNQFKLYSLDGLSQIWRIDNLTMDNSTSAKSFCNFTITIAAEIRTPAWGG